MALVKLRFQAMVEIADQLEQEEGPDAVVHTEGRSSISSTLEGKIVEGLTVDLLLLVRPNDPNGDHGVLKEQQRSIWSMSAVQ